MKVLNVMWLHQINNSTPIGLVKAEDPTTKEIKFYIGTGIGLPNVPEKADIDLILKWGSKFKPEVITKFLKNEKQTQD